MKISQPSKQKNLSILKKTISFLALKKNIFLDPNLIEKELEKCESATQKLEFVYDYINNNTHKNRFALYEASDKSECKLYKDENKRAFKSLKFLNLKSLKNLKNRKSRLYHKDLF